MATRHERTAAICLGFVQFAGARRQVQVRGLKTETEALNLVRLMAHGMA